MRFSRVATSALGAAWLMVVAHGGSAQACQLQQYAELPVTMAGAEPLVDVTLNGRTLRFLVDTGSSSTVLTEAGAAQLGLAPVHVEGVTFYGAGGSAGASRVRIKDFRLGAMVAHDLDVTVLGKLKSDHYSGLLGRDLLLAHDLELDLANRVIRLLLPKDCQGDEVVYWNKPYSLASIDARSTAIQVDASLNGKHVPAMLDSGAFHSIVTLDAARAAGVTPQSLGVAADGTISGIGGTVPTWIGAFQTLGVGAETVQNAELELSDLFSKDKEVRLGSIIPKAVMEQPAMLLGVDFVKAHRIYVARSQGKVYFSYNGGRIFEAPAKAH